MREDWSERLLVVIRRYYDPSSDAGRRRNDAEARPDDAITRVNRSCGDRVTVYCRRQEPTGIAVDVRGCSICKASAAMVELVAESLLPEDLPAFCDAMIRRINGSAETEDLASHGQLPPRLRDDLESLCVLAEVPARRRCATLSWEAVREYLGGTDAR